MGAYSYCNRSALEPLQRHATVFTVFYCAFFPIAVFSWIGYIAVSIRKWLYRKLIKQRTTIPFCDQMHIGKQQITEIMSFMLNDIHISRPIKMRT